MNAGGAAGALVTMRDPCQEDGRDSEACVVWCVFCLKWFLTENIDKGWREENNIPVSSVDLKGFL